MAGEPREAPEEGLESFAPTGGRVTGVLGLVLAAGVAGLWLVARDEVPAPLAAAALVAGVLAWASLLRPRVSVSSETLHLRNMLETVHVPLAAIDELAVRQVLAVRVGEKRFVSPAVGRKLRAVMRAPRPGQILMPKLPESMDDPLGPTSEQHPSTDIDHADHVEARLRHLVEEAHARHGIARYSEEAEALARGVRRVAAWPEIVALVLATIVLVLTLVL